MRAALVLAACLALAACAPDRVEAPEPDADFTARAVGFLEGLQARSVAGDREYCGYLGYDGAGNFAFSGPQQGGEAWCEPVRPGDLDVIASYHTHGAYGHEHDAEVPSPEDVDTDVAEGVFGYVSTPGGRVWLIDWRDATATQVCGLGCIIADPFRDPAEDGRVARVYTRDDLAARFGY